MRVYVYRNVRKNCFSVRALEGKHKGRVIASVEQIMLTDAQTRVSQAGRERVISSGHKNVHAGIVGHVEAVWGAQLREDIDNKTVIGLAINKPWAPFKGSPIRYNPTLNRGFVRLHDGALVTSARRVRLSEGRAWAAGIK